MSTDQRDWFEPRISEHIGFVQDVNLWIQAVKLRQEEAKKVSDEIQPEDSVSVTSKKSKNLSLSALLLEHRQLILSS